VARGERPITSRPIAGAGANRASEKSVARSPLPVGCRLTVIPEEAALVRYVFQLFLDSYGERAIAKQLNVQNAGRIWRTNTIYLMLQNPKHVGRLYFNCREWIE